MNLGLNEIFAVIDKVKSAELDGFEYSDVDMKIKIKNCGGKVDSKSCGIGYAIPEQQENAGESVVVESPMVGTFYVAPSEGAAPFVTVGDRVKCGQVIGIIEAMKLMNEIEANADGIVEEILVGNETMVEFGQPLLKIRKNG